MEFEFEVSDVAYLYENTKLQANEMEMYISVNKGKQILFVTNCMYEMVQYFLKLLHKLRVAIFRKLLQGVIMDCAKVRFTGLNYAINGLGRCFAFAVCAASRGGEIDRGDCGAVGVGGLKRRDRERPRPVQTQPPTL